MPIKVPHRFIVQECYSHAGNSSAVGASVSTDPTIAVPEN